MTRSPKLPAGPVIDLKTGELTLAWRRFFEGERGGASITVTNFNSSIAALNARLAAEEAARLAGLTAVESSGDGSGTTNSALWSAKGTSGTTWVTLATCTVTPTGAGTYTFTISPDAATGRTDPAPSDGQDLTFLGNWRVVEEETGGGTPVVKASGTFSVYQLADSSFGGFVLPGFTTVLFNSLLTSVANTYSVQADLRFEVQRASGTNNAAGLSGSMLVSWS